MARLLSLDHSRASDLRAKNGLLDPSNEWQSHIGRTHDLATKKALALAQKFERGERMQPLWRDYLRDPVVKLSGALNSLAADAGRQAAYTLRDQIDHKKADYDPVVWHALRKRDGGYRTVCKLPPQMKALHKILKKPLERMLDRPDNLFGVRGFNRITWLKESFGRDDLADCISNLQNNGWTNLATLDVRSCYPSVNLDPLYEMSWLPKEVIRHSIDTRNIRFRYIHEVAATATADVSGIITDTDKVTGPTGLMQGSPVSPILLARLLTPFPTSEHARVYLCHDNLIVLAKSPGETRVMVDTLVVHFERCQAGPLTLCEPIYADHVPIEFLGYLFDPDCTTPRIGERGLERILNNLVLANSLDEEEIEKTWKLHEENRAQNAMFNSQNPFLNTFPTKTWRAILSARSGYRRVSDEDQDLEFLRDASAYLAQITGNGMAAHLHSNLFATKETEEARLIRGILTRQPGYK